MYAHREYILVNINGKPISGGQRFLRTFNSKTFPDTNFGIKKNHNYQSQKKKRLIICPPKKTTKSETRVENNYIK